MYSNVDMSGAPWTTYELTRILGYFVTDLYTNGYANDILYIKVNVSYFHELADEFNRTAEAIASCWYRMREWGYFKCPPKNTFEEKCQTAFSIVYGYQKTIMKKDNRNWCPSIAPTGISGSIIQ